MKKPFFLSEKRYQTTKFCNIDNKTSFFFDFCIYTLFIYDLKKIYIIYILLIFKKIYI